MTSTSIQHGRFGRLILAALVVSLLAFTLTPLIHPLAWRSGRTEFRLQTGKHPQGLFEDDWPLIGAFPITWDGFGWGPASEPICGTVCCLRLGRLWYWAELREFPDSTNSGNPAPRWPIP